jgi:hypothetical protein
MALAAAWPLLPAYGQQKRPIRPKPDAAPAATGEQSAEDDTRPPEGDAQAAPGTAASAGGKDTRLTLEDIQRLRRQRMTAEEVAEKVAEQGRAFEVTAEVVGQLRRLGFRPAQIDAVKESSAEPLTPGKWLTTGSQRRNQIFNEMKQVAAKSRAAVEPVQSQHATLWAGKDIQPVYLPDVQKLEKFFHTKCAEPIRSGLDKRSTHIVLLKDRAEYEAWWRAMFDLFGEEFDEKDNSGGANGHFREQVLKYPVFYWWDLRAISLGELRLDWAHRDVAYAMGNMYFSQLANEPPRVGPLQTGFADGAETVVCGSPSVMTSWVAYHEQARVLGEDRRPWGLLVQQRMATNQATPLGELLQMDNTKMSQPHYAEGWTLVGLLNRQPAKFGKLLLAMREGGPELEAIEKVYGWAEKKLAKEWRAYVTGQTSKKR